jgi:hypothetical protein
MGFSLGLSVALQKENSPRPHFLTTNAKIEKNPRIRFHPRMLRSSLIAVCLLIAASLHAGPVPPELEKALATFQSEGTRGWAFTQTTQSSDSTLVERYDPSKPEFNRWKLLQKDGREPTEAEVKTYKDALGRGNREQAAPNVKNQVQQDTCEPLGEENGRARYRFQLKPGGEDDKSAEHMVVIFSLHLSTGTIERVELVSVRPFSPMFGVKIEEARTVIDYTLPDEARPTLLKEIHVSVRGRAMLFKSLDRTMAVTYADYSAPAPPREKP